MRKTALILSILTAVLVANQRAAAGGKDVEPSCLQATWELKVAKLSCMPNEPGIHPKERCKIKIITGTHFTWVDYERASGKVLAMAGGACDLKGSTYTETIQFASKELESIVGKTFVFQVKTDGEKLIQSGSLGEGTDLEETWQRAVPASPAVAMVPPKN